MNKKLNLFYEEPDPDRWFKYDRYPRKIVRRIVRKKQRPGGVMTIAINLMKGLDKLGVGYRLNDYKYIAKHPKEIACIIGKPQVFFQRKWINPVIFGAGIYSHPIECPDLFERYSNVKRFLVPGEWMRKMCEPYYGKQVRAWPVGINTDEWKPSHEKKSIDLLIYDKLPMQYPIQMKLIDLIQTINQQRFSYQIIKYGSYTHIELIKKIEVSKAVIFLSESETQGLAYQQVLAMDTPVLAWDRGGFWKDPAYYPEKVRFEPVTAVPYWDERCGMKFSNVVDFKETLGLFMNKLDGFKPRDYIMENLTLEKCAEKYLEIYREVEKEVG